MTTKIMLVANASSAFFFGLLFVVYAAEGVWLMAVPFALFGVMSTVLLQHYMDVLAADRADRFDAMAARHEDNANQRSGSSVD